MIHYKYSVLKHIKFVAVDLFLKKCIDHRYRSSAGGSKNCFYKIGGISFGRKLLLVLINLLNTVELVVNGGNNNTFYFKTVTE
jgi:hypothetical protein